MIASGSFGDILGHQNDAGKNVTELSFVRGQPCAVGVDFNDATAGVVAEIYSGSVHANPNALAGAFVLVHDLEPADAEKAMNFFASEPSLLIDAERLVEECGAALPALVTIRSTDLLEVYMSTMYQSGFLMTLPDDDVVNHAGWELFWAYEGIVGGADIPEAPALGDYDARKLRRKVLALRASVQEDRDPWLEAEFDQLRALVASQPDGAEAMIARAEDMEAAIKGDVTLDNTFSIVIPTTIERRVMIGAIHDWRPQPGKEIVVAHGLDALQAARALKLVQDDPAAFVSENKLLKGDGREIVRAPYVKADRRLNWMSTDFSGRRSPAGYLRLQASLNAQQGHGLTQSRGSGHER